MKKLKFICHDNKDDQIAQFTFMSVSGWLDYFIFLIFILSVLLVWSSFESEKKFKDYFTQSWIFLWISLIGSLGLIINSLFFSVTAEILIIAAPLGIQLITSYKLRPDNITFLPWRKIKDFLILEVLACQKVVYVFALLIREEGNEEDKLEILFPGTKPRLQPLEKIYQVSQRILEKNSNSSKDS